MDGKPESEAEPSEFPEWELLQHNSSNEPPLDFTPQLDSPSPSPLIRPDYFSLHPNIPNSNSNSSANSTTDPSEVDRNFDDSYVASQLFQSSSNLHIWNDSDNNKSLSDSDSDAKTTVTAETTTTTTIIAPGELLVDGDGDDGLNSKEEEEVVESASEEKRRMVWWKVPFEVLKYWVVRVSPVPVWSLSVAAAAAFLGLLILGRRLYKMKRKTQTLKLDLALDDKKVSQFMGRVARLNEAFSVVRRVPIVRPSLPASSVTLRPVMSMR